MGCKKVEVKVGGKKHQPPESGGVAAEDAAKMIAKEKTQICSEIDFLGIAEDTVQKRG